MNACDCGAERTKTPPHSTWCSMHEKKGRTQTPELSMQPIQAATAKPGPFTEIDKRLAALPQPPLSPVLAGMQRDDKFYGVNLVVPTKVLYDGLVVKWIANRVVLWDKAIVNRQDLLFREDGERAEFVEEIASALMSTVEARVAEAFRSGDGKDGRAAGLPCWSEKPNTMDNCFGVNRSGDARLSFREIYDSADMRSGERISDCFIEPQTWLLASLGPLVQLISEDTNSRYLYRCDDRDAYELRAASYFQFVCIEPDRNARIVKGTK